MDPSSSLDELFRVAVSALDAGDVSALEPLITEHPRLVSDRLEAPGAWLRDKVGNALDDFFERPYLLWFVAEDPVRNGALPANVADVTRTIIRAAQRAGAANLQEQLLSTALCLERWNDARRLATDATERQKQFALTLAALKGKAEALRRLLAAGVEVNGVSQDLYSHATALHHAVSSGSLEAVTVLVAAGADLRARDTAYHGTPLGWAEYSSGKSPYDEIAAYLRKRGAPV